MQRYYFDLKFDSESPTHDEEGLELADLGAAQIEAVGAISDMCNETVRSNRELQQLAIVVRDDLGPIFTAELSFRTTRLN